MSVLSPVRVGLAMMERGLLPDFVTRAGIRRLCAERLREEADRGSDRLDRFLAEMSAAEIAPVPHKANEQHYELPQAFFECVLGSHLKYSGCYFRSPGDSLDVAEANMLALTCERAELADGQDILELGCGWGSLSLWMAEHYPNSRILAVSNSPPQRRFIEGRCRSRGIENLTVQTADMNAFETPRRFDRVVSVEMFEHMRNWRRLLGHVRGWLRPGAKLFLHIFCHARHAYPFEARGDDDWMGRYFFTGGIMPAYHLPLQFGDIVAPEQHWAVDGTHYARTSEAWLANLDSHREAVLPILAGVYGDAEAPTWLQRWRVFFMACAELFAYANGSEWIVGHYRLARVDPQD